MDEVGTWTGSRRDLLRTGAGLAALTGAGLLTGCGVGGGAGSGGGAVSDSALAPWRKAKLDWKRHSGTSLVFGAEQHPWVKAIQPHLPKFKALTGIDVRLQVSGESDFTAKLPVQLGGGSATPDVFLVPSYPQYVASNWVEPLTAYQRDAKQTDRAFYDDADLFETGTSFVKWKDGKDYALAITAEVETIFYRSDLVSGPLTTFEDVARAARAAKKGGVAGIALRGKAESTMGWTCQGFVFAYGGQLIDGSGRAGLDSPEAVRALSFYADLLRAAGPPGAAGWDWQQVNQAFENGTAAMVIDSSVFGAEYLDPETNRHASKVRAAPFPRRDGELRPNLWHWVVGMNRRSAHKGAAWLFLQWATCPPTAALLGAAGVSVPRRSVWRSAAFRKTYPSAAADVVLGMIEDADSEPYDRFYLHPKWPQVGTQFASAMSSVIAGSAAAAPALRAAQKQAVKTLGSR